jgi:hypothetical protein
VIFHPRHFIVQLSSRLRLLIFKFQLHYFIQQISSLQLRATRSSKSNSCSPPYTAVALLTWLYTTIGNINLLNFPLCFATTKLSIIVVERRKEFNNQSRNNQLTRYVVALRYITLGLGGVCRLTRQ